MLHIPTSFFTPDELRSGLEEKGYKAVDIIFLFKADLLYRVTGYPDNALSKTDHTAYSDFPNKLLFKSSQLVLAIKHVSQFESSLDILKTKSGPISGCLQNENLFVLKINLVNYLAEDVELLGNLSVPSESPLKRLNYIIIRLIIMMAMIELVTIEESATEMNMSFAQRREALTLFPECVEHSSREAVGSLV